MAVFNTMGTVSNVLSFMDIFGQKIERAQKEKSQKVYLTQGYKKMDDGANVGIALVSSHHTGDVLKLRLVFDEDESVIDVSGKAIGSQEIQSGLILLSRMIIGMTHDDILEIQPEELCDDIYCSELLLTAVVSAVNSYVATRIE